MHPWAPAPATYGTRRHPHSTGAAGSDLAALPGPAGFAGAGRGPVLHAPPSPGTTVTEPHAPLAPDWSVSVRNQVVDRLVTLNRNHAQVTWQARSGPVSPNAIAFLYADPINLADERTGAINRRAWRVVAATLVVPDTPDVRELPNLLYRLTRLARERYAATAGGFDPRTHMSVYQDNASGNAEYIGLAVSTLDSLDLSWEQARQDAQDVDDLGGRAIALLADHTALLIDRGPARRTRADLGIHCTGQLDFYGDLSPRMLWTHHPSVVTMPANREVWDLAYHLHTLVYQQNPRPTL